MLVDISLATNIYIVIGYTGMRKSIDGLCAIVLEHLKCEPDSRDIYMFCGKCLDVIHGRYRWPRDKSEAKPITW